MDRIFDTGTVEDICTEAKEVIRETEACMKSLKDIASDIQGMMGEVPSQVRHGSLTGEASALKQTLGKGHYDEAMEKLKMCQEKACTVIPQYDSQYAAQMGDVTDAARRIQGVIEGLEEFMQQTPLTMDTGEFKDILEAKEQKWRRELKAAEETLEDTVANAKGAQEISTLYSDDPVNLSTGNFIYDREDLSSGGNPPFVFRRFYNSRNRYHGALGADWNHNYEVRLAFKENGEGGEDVSILLEDGKEENFYPVDGRRYVAGNQSLAELERTEEGYEYATLSGERYRFDKGGRYLRKEDANGNGFSLIYAEDGERTALTEVQKDSGESFTLSYTEEGYLRKVTDHAGRSFSYEVRGGRLKRAERPDGGSFSYEYGRNGKLAGVTNPRGITTVRNTYDSQDRTVCQEFPDGTRMEYGYDDGKHAVSMTERNGSRSVHYHDGKYRNVRNVYSDGEERYEYNTRNQKTKITDKLGNTTRLSYDSRGNLTGVINALGTKLSVTYGAHNKPVSISIDGRQKVKNTYDSRGNLLESRDALGRRTTFSYDGKGQPKEVVQADGSRICLSYDGRGNVLEARDARGGVSRYAYDALNRVREAQDANGNVTKFTYDAGGNVLTVENAAGETRSYAYNESGKVTRVTDFDGSVREQSYNALNKPEKVTDQMGRETLLQYDAMWNLARVTGPDGARTTYLYNENNRLTRVKDALGNVTRYTYDGNGNRLSEEDALGNVTRFSYDALGRLIKVTDPEEAETAYGYDGEGNLVKETDALGNETTYEYDAAGQLIRETNPLGDSRSYTYTPLGDIESMTDEAGRTTRYGYFPGGELERVLYSDGTEESYTYDGNGNVKTYRNKEGYLLTYTYDSLDRLTEVSGEDGAKSRYAYDAAGNVTAVTDALGNTTSYRYSLTGQLVKVTDALGNETEYLYDETDQLIEVRQYGEGVREDLGLKKVQEGKRDSQTFCDSQTCHVTRYVRNLLGQVETVIDALGQEEHYRYSPKGELLQKTDREGYITKYSYTRQGDISRILYGDGREAKFRYNPLRQLERIEDWLGTTRIVNDALGRAERVAYPDGKEVGYTYGKAGERRSITYPDGRTVTYGYDGEMRLTELRDGEDAIRYSYDPAGRLLEKVFPNGTRTAYTYDRRSRVTALTHMDGEGIIDRYAYEYDPSGNKTGIRKERRNLAEEGGQYAYGYDALGRLTEARKDGSLLRRYGYDAFENRTELSEGGRRTEYAYNALNQLVARRDGLEETLYRYDRRGNLTELTENGVLKNRYAYGALNRLERAEGVGGIAARYQYNGLGYRTGKEVKTGAGSEKRIRYVTDLTREYHNLLERYEGESCQTYLWDGNVARMSERSPETEMASGGKLCRKYYLQDELGSPLRLSGADGSLGEAYGYDEFGRDLYGNQGEAQPFGYTGYQYDSVAGTYFAQAREYEPGVGRFAGMDVIGGFVDMSVTLNRYGYCWNNPEKYVDRDGEFPITVAIGAGIGAIVGGVGSAVSQAYSGGKINWKDVGIDALSGAATGAIAGTGVGAVGLALGGAGVGMGNYVAKTTVNNQWKKKSIGSHVLEGGLNAVEWSLATVAGGNISPVKLNALQNELKFSQMMLKEAVRGIPDRLFYEAVKKDIVNEIVKTTWKTLFSSFARTFVVGAIDALYNMFGKEELLELMRDIKNNCPISI